MFKRVAKILPAACLATSAAWAAESPFIGQWTLDASKSRMPDEMKVANTGGKKYAFDFGGATETIALDGDFQPGYGDTLLSVKTQAPDTWVVERKKDGRLLLKATWKLSKDGTTLTDYFRQFDADGSTLSMDYIYRRSGGGSGFSGDWQSIKETMNSPFTMQVKAFDGDGLSFITPSQHTTRNVKFDGKDHPKDAANAGNGATAAGKLTDERTLLVTDKVAGNVSDTKEMTLSADLKTLTMKVSVPGRDHPNVMVFERN
ncbi:MAG TPA: hypothetical protein VH082_07835 [Rudaea sp.]|nr:hypothetical protein [Rudaea sp.]